MDFRTQLERFLAPLSNRIRLMLARAVIKGINDDANIQQMAIGILAGELKDKVEHYQTYGFSSNPLPGMDVLTAFLGGDRSNAVVVAVADRKFRIKGKKPGEVVVYTDEGDTIFLKRGHNIEVNTGTYTVNTKKYIVNASETAEINTPSVKASGSISDVSGTMQKMRDEYNTHSHTENNIAGQNTSLPSVPMS